MFRLHNNRGEERRLTFAKNMMELRLQRRIFIFILKKEGLGTCLTADLMVEVQKKFKMRSKSQDLTFQRWKIVRFRHSN